MTTPDDDTVIGMSIMISTGDLAFARTSSRATPAGEYDAGDEYENFVNLQKGDLRLWFLNEDDTYAKPLIVNSVVPIDNGANGFKRYNVLGSIKPSDEFDPSKQKFKILVLANWGEYPDSETLIPGETTLDDIVKSSESILTYNPESDLPSETNPIPLFGIREYAPVEFVPNRYSQVETVNLLRAYAKVDIMMPADEERWEIRSVELSRSCKNAAKAPYDINEMADYVKNNWLDDYTSNPTILPDSEILMNVKFKKINGKHFRLYVPEFLNINSVGEPLSEDQRTRILIRFTDTNTGWESVLGERIIEFKYYNAPAGYPELAGKHFNVMRNTWYKFTINKSDEIGSLDVHIDVQPYASVELNPDFGLERDPIDGYIILKKNDQGIPTLFYDDEFSNYYDSQKYLLKSNYAAQISRVKNPPFGLKGEIWLIKRANGHTDDIGSTNAVMSLFYDALTGIYYDAFGESLNLIYDGNKTSLDFMGEVYRDILYNNIVMSNDENSMPSSYYDFTIGKYMGASNPNKIDPVTKLFERIEVGRLNGGWIQIIPYWKDWDIEENGAHLYYNVYTRKYYDIDGYCLQVANYEFEYYVSEKSREITLKSEPGDDGRPLTVYNREDGKYYSYTYTADTTVRAEIPRPVGFTRDERLNYTPWPQTKVTNRPIL